MVTWSPYVNINDLCHRGNQVRIPGGAKISKGRFLGAVSPGSLGAPENVGMFFLPWKHWKLAKIRRSYHWWPFFFKDPWKCKEKTTWTCSKDLPWCSTNTSDGFDAFHQTKRNFLAKQNQKLEPKWEFYGKDTILSNTWDIISSAGLTPRTPPWWRVEIRSDWLATNTHIGSMFCTSLVTNVFLPDKLLAVFERYRYTLSSQPSWGIQRCQWKIPFIDYVFDFPIISHFGSGISQPCRQMIHQTRHLQDPLTGTHVSMFHVEVRLPRSGRSLKYILHQPGTMNLLYSLEVTSVTFLWEPVRTQFQIG